MLKIGWFSTGRGEGSRGLLRFVQEHIVKGQLNARIEFVFSNREPGEADGSDQFFQMVRGFGIPLMTLSSTRFHQKKGNRTIAPNREEYDRQVMRLLQNYHPDVCALAGYMLIIGSEMCRSYTMLNLHPALPDGPTGTWQEVIWKLMDERRKWTGAMVHLATEDLDKGPVVSYCAAQITGKPFDRHWQALNQTDLTHIKATQGERFPLFQLIRQTEYRLEPFVLLETLKSIAQGRLVIKNGQVMMRKDLSLELTRTTGLCLNKNFQNSLTDGEGKGTD
jgi:phosphoribosylglycinamide formyltransferase-1